MDVAGGGGVAGDGGGFRTYADIEQHFNNMESEGLSAQARIDFIVPHLISLLPPPFVPASDADDASDSDDDHFSLTSSDSDDEGGAAAGADWPAFLLNPQDDGQDHISRLTNDLLSNIISRLPTKQAARTMLLSTRWRRVWAATPLLVDDAHLRAGRESRGMSGFGVARAVSRCVAAHPGPVRAVRITRISFHQQEYALQGLVASLAAKNVQDLILFNRPWPLNMPLPDAVRSCASLTRLYIGIWHWLWHFPDTAARRPAFPNLHELAIFHTIVEEKQVDALLRHCPKLKILSFALEWYRCPSRLRVKSRSLRVLMEWRCAFDEVVVDDVPCLERLLFDSIFEPRPIKIVHAPKLEVLGFLDLQIHMLEIGGFVIKAGMKNVRARSMLPSLKILAVKVRFSDDMEVQMLPTLLRCFPCLETLHIMSIPSGSPDIEDHAELWKSLPSSDCLRSHLKTLVLHGFKNLDHELLFLNYILEKGKVLKTVCVVRSEHDNVAEEVGPMSGFLLERNAPSGGSSGSDISVCPASRCWSFQHAIDLSVKDPFYVPKHDVAWIACRTEDETAY